MAHPSCHNLLSLLHVTHLLVGGLDVEELDEGLDGDALHEHRPVHHRDRRRHEHRRVRHVLRSGENGFRFICLVRKSARHSSIH